MSSIPGSRNQSLQTILTIGGQPPRLTVYVVIVFLLWGLLLSPFIGIGATTGQSMDPTIESGDIIIWTSMVEPSVGDIVRVSPEKAGYPMPIAHRVINDTETEIRTQGNNNTVADPWFEDENVDGTVIHIIDMPF